MSIMLLPIAALLINLLNMIAYFSKQRINSEETKLYSKMLVVNFVASIAAIITILVAKEHGDVNIIAILQKIYMSLLLLLVVYIVNYHIYLAKLSDDVIKISKRFMRLSYIFFATLVLFLPLIVINDTNIIDGYGLSYTALIFASAMYFSILTIALLMLIFSGETNWKKEAPFIVLVILFIISLLIRSIFPEIIFETFFLSYTLLIMYFTIENPDLKLLVELNLAKENAEKANRAKSDFLSSMSHEIRTPLNAIVGLSEDMADNNSCPKEMREDLEDVLNASKTLLEIVGNIMDISKIESNKLEIIDVKYNLLKEAETLVRLNKARIGTKKLVLTTSYAEDIPKCLVGDKLHIKQIINNLLSNAIKYTEEGEVNFSIKCINNNDDSILVITVKDTGIGIKSENIKKLFTKFERLDIEKNTTTEGTGLGLAITKKLVELMGGTINAQSIYGKGSIFIVQIPQKICHQKITDTQFIKKKDILDNLKYTNKNVLIVDDNKLNIKVARRSLSSFNFKTIDECYDGIECLDMVSKNKYDLILLDIMMPNMNGEETITKLKQDPDFNIPVIALTADALQGAKEKYLDLGFTDYISKPFSKDQIKYKIDYIFMQKKDQ